MQRSMYDLFTGVSICFTLLFLFSALLNLYLLRNEVGRTHFKAILRLQMIVFAIAFIFQIKFTFLPPIVCAGLVTTAAILAWYYSDKAEPTTK